MIFTAYFAILWWAAKFPEALAASENQLNQPKMCKKKKNSAVVHSSPVVHSTDYAWFPRYIKSVQTSPCVN